MSRLFAHILLLPRNKNEKKISALGDRIMVDDYFIFRSFLCCIYFVMNRYDFCNGKNISVNISIIFFPEKFEYL